MDDPKRKKGAIDALKTDFYANSSRSSVTKKRQEVEKLAMKATGSTCPYPLVEEAVVGVAAEASAGGPY